MPKASTNKGHDQYQTLYQGFRWAVPTRFNIARVCGERWANNAKRASKVAIYYEGTAIAPQQLSYKALWDLSLRLAAWLSAQGIGPGDRVAIVLPQRPETAMAHLACYALGAVAVPLSMLFGEEALLYRLQDSEAIAAITDDDGEQRLQVLRQEVPRLASTVSVGARFPSQKFMATLWAQTPVSQIRDTLADDPALLIYTSGTTGPPKGASIPHRAMIGNLSGFVASQNWYPHNARCFWSPADWAWTGGLWDALLPTLYFGESVLGYQGRFSPETAFRLLTQYKVSHTFIFPTALKAMMKYDPNPRSGHKLSSLRGIMSAGEFVGDVVAQYCAEGLGVPVNEMFGQTEMNYVVGNSYQRWPIRPGSMGRSYPGHRVSVIDEEGLELPAGKTGEVAVHRRDIHGHLDPVFFLGYWKNPEGTQKKFTGDWCRTGDLAQRDKAGYLWYEGRADDVFKSAGYRIGPSEIENCMLRHAAVANVAVVPKPDAERGNLVKAYVVLAEGQQVSEALTAALQDHVRQRLAPYEYPKEIEYIDALPMTTSGKIQRHILRKQEEARAR